MFLFINFFNAKCKKYSRHFSFIKCRNAYLIFLVELFFTCMRFSVYFITLKMFTSSNIKFWLSGFSRTSSVFNGHEYKFLWKWKKGAFTASKCIFQSPILSKNIKMFSPVIIAPSYVAIFTEINYTVSIMNLKINKLLPTLS